MKTRFENSPNGGAACSKTYFGPITKGATPVEAQKGIQKLLAAKNNGQIFTIL